MWSTPSSTARRRTAIASSRSRGGPKTPGPGSCIAPNPMRRIGRPLRENVVSVMATPCATVAVRTRGASIVGVAPPPSEARRAELSDFLRTRRANVAPEDVGLEANGRRRTPGVRREEVAQLVGVGLSWYTWLEQARDIHPSPQVLDAIARVLALDAAERAHLFHRARVELPLPEGDYPREASAELRAFVQAIDPHPAYAFGPRSTCSPGTPPRCGCSTTGGRSRSSGATSCGGCSPTRRGTVRGRGGRGPSASSTP